MYHLKGFTVPFVLCFGTWSASGLQNTPKDFAFRSVAPFSNSTSLAIQPNISSAADPPLTPTPATSSTGLGLTTSSGSSTTSTSTTISGNEIPSYTDLPPFTVPTVALTAGPEETTEAIKAAPVLWYLWQKKSLLQDEEHKQEYIDDVKKSRDNFVALFNQFHIKPLSKPECQRTSLAKRSLISGIIDTLTSAADLISCGVDVLNNLVDSVQKVEPPMSVVDLLTNTLKDIGDELEKEDDEPTSSTSSSASSTKSSSSCTTTFTKTWESVLCTVTATPSANHKRQDQPCTTHVYSTVTGCSAVGLTVTSTTTTTPGTKPTPQCSFESCGTGSTCPNQKRGLEKRLPQRDTQPEANSWVGPENYKGNIQDFMAGEVGLLYRAVDDNPLNRAVQLGPGTTSELIRFNESPSSLALSGLYGCTSLIAVSKRGAWVSHMWEAPSFTYSYFDPAPPTDLEQLDIFRQQVLNALHSGNGNYHQVALAQLRDSSSSHIMDDDADPHVFIFTPYTRAEDNSPNYNNEFPVGLPERWGEDDGLPSKTQQIENEVKAIFSVPNGFNVPYEKVLYAPRQWKVPTIPEDLSDSKLKGLPPAPVMPDIFHQRENTNTVC